MQKPLSRESLASQLYAALRRSLMDGQYPPGHRLTIAGLAEEFGTSITPVREAIFRLVSERALEMRAATSVQVPGFDPNRLREVQQIRIELEGLSAFSVAEKITASELDGLHDIHRRFVLAAAKDPAKASLLNRDFHFALLRLSGMPLVEGICENMWTLMGPFLRTFHDRMPKRELSGTTHKHHDLLVALRARDPMASRLAMQADIRWGETLIEQLEQEIPRSASA